MDLEEWEVLSDDGFLEIHDDGGNKIFSRKYAAGVAADDDDPNNCLNNNYFICPSPKKSYSPNQLVLPVPIQFEDQDDGKEELKSPSSPPVEVGGGASMETVAPSCDDQEGEAAVSQVFFKKVKETHEFVDMKLDSPKSTTTGGGGGWGVVPQIEPAVPKVQFDKESTDAGDAGNNNKVAGGSEIEDDGMNNLWRWSLHGIGAICSFGVAAATICIIILGNSSSSNSHHRNQKIRFQVYADDEKRMIKQVVVEQANSKLNEAILAVRGVPLSRRAHFTCGGYYEGL